MFSKNFVAIAMLGYVFTATAFGQKEIVIWQAAKGTKTTSRKTNVKSPRDVATGQVMDAGAILGDEVKKAPSTKNQRTVKKPRGGNLIDTSTGEIVWADEVKASKPHTPGTKGFDRGYLPPAAKARKRNR